MQIEPVKGLTGQPNVQTGFMTQTEPNLIVRSNQKEIMPTSPKGTATNIDSSHSLW